MMKKEQRLGTIYKQVSPEAAKERGLEIVSAKLPSFVKEFSGYEGKKAVFCWRGGMRSKNISYSSVSNGNQSFSFKWWIPCLQKLGSRNIKYA